MKNSLTTLTAIFACLAAPAIAQQQRSKLEAPGKVTFGTTYEQAAAILGKDAEPYGLDPPQPGIKALLCDKCAPLPNVEGFTMYFQEKSGLVRLEAFAIAGAFKSVDECQKADGGMMPKLVELYGKPDSNSNSKKGTESLRTASFKFADGATVDHVTNISKPGRPCTYTIVYKSKSAPR